MAFRRKTMTTGSIINNLLYSGTIIYNGSPLTSASYGSYRSKVWSGSDDPTKDLSKRNFEKKYYYVPVEVRLKSGRVKQRLLRQSYRVYNRNKHRREPNVYSMVSESNWYPPGSLTTTVYNSSGTPISFGTWTNTPLSTFINGGGPLAKSITTADAYRAIANLRERVVGSPFNCAVAVGEAGKTFDMIGATATKLARSLSLLKRGRFQDAIAATADPRSRGYSRKYATNPYLEVTYGWTPLLMDLKSGAESLAHRFSVPFRQRYRVQVRGRDSLSNGRIQVQSPSSPGYDWSVYGYTGVTRQIIAEIYDNPSWIEAVGFTDPASFIWERMPYSFVADWFFPFGDWLEARASAGLLRGKFVVTDTKRVTIRGPIEGVFIDPSLGSRTVIAGLDAASSVSYTRVDRSVAFSLDVPMPSYESLTGNLSVRRAISGVALMFNEFAPGGRSNNAIRSLVRKISS